jgi:beta-lactam-binding protein with PASTA domain
MKTILRWVLRLAFLALLGVIFVFSSYFAFNLFQGSGVTKVPDLTGLTEGEGGRLLADQGLIYERHPDSDRFDEELEVGKIVQQKPGPGSLIKRGFAIRVGLSRGAERVEVPDLGGMAVQAAQVTVAASGLPMGRAMSIFSDLGEAGTVVDQDPPAGTEVDTATPVHLMVAKGNALQAYVMPDLVYRPYESVRKAFERADLRVGNVKFEPYEGVPDGVILRQFPLAGHPLRRQDGVFLVVSSAGVEGGGLP